MHLHSQFFARAPEGALRLGQRTSVMLACALTACQLEAGGRGSVEFDSTDSSITELLDGDASADGSDGAGPELMPDDLADARGAAPDVRGGENCAAPLLWYADDDHDGYGEAERTWLSCETPPDGASVAGDCADHDARVHPQQASYFGDPYQRDDGSESFDFDCSGSEEGEEGVPIAPASCGLLSLALCGGSGYAITTRGGANINRACGSRVQQRCQAAALGLLVCEAVTTAVAEPYACR